MTDLPSQAEIDAVAAVFERLDNDPIAAGSAIITTKLLKRALEDARRDEDTPKHCRQMAIYWMHREREARAKEAEITRQKGGCSYERDVLLPCWLAGWP
jgi:hypothetical protein